ncbi:hypothetical protein IQ266_20365 [filamentous cyanobacterium LEGE 11480]|uniref:Uncharacterized protein n=1 Tax=Romeriopsis navalis LEGE 11480 TaxID=2777977 RepID=A0A928VSC9_9CYAN|nr:hypothetical protein [Romeriopsis navalis]MBE9032096.1 hypothetical protein [Romeriopsis navalis LEGE 11480]
MKPLNRFLIGTIALALNGCITLDPVPEAQQAPTPDPLQSTAPAIAAPTPVEPQATTPKASNQVASKKVPNGVSNFTPLSSGLTDQVDLFKPPANIHRAPNGQVLCSIKQAKSIKISGYTNTDQGTWYQTNACGSNGWISMRHVRF